MSTTCCHGPANGLYKVVWLGWSYYCVYVNVSHFKWLIYGHTLSKYCCQHEDTGSWVSLSGCVSVFEMLICIRSGQEQSHDVIEIKNFFFISFLFFFGLCSSQCCSSESVFRSKKFKGKTLYCCCSFLRVAC